MADKVRFYSPDPNQPLRGVSLANDLTGESEEVMAKNGVIETSNPGWLPWLEQLAAWGHLTKTPPKPKGA